MSNKNCHKKRTNEIVSSPTQESTELETGIVTNCLRLNIREKPDKIAKVICVVDAFSELLVDSRKSTDKWFKVYTEAGDEGFCMKEFVAITDKERVKHDG